MARKITDENKIKIFILYLLNKLDRKMDFNTLAEIILWDGTINYFYFADGLAKLTENGLVEKLGEEENGIYQITELGRNILADVEDDLLNTAKEKLMRSSARLFAYKKNGSMIKGEIEKLDEGYNLHCSIVDRDHELLKLSVYLDNIEEADYMKEMFEDKAEIVYRGVIALLTGEARYWS